MPPGTSGVNGAKVPRESGESSIDSLPDGVLQHIIGFLPARDAVRTCVLAQRWRDLWMLATGLRITASADDDMGELREFVDHIFLLRGIAPLETCEMRFDSIVDADTFSSGDALRVNLWFQHAVRCQTRVVRLAMTGEFELCDLNGARLVSQHLMELELVGVAVKESFLNLSGCPELDQLLLDDSDMCHVKKISSESLKRLSISYCFLSKSFRTHIDTPSLVSLRIDGNFHNTPVLESMPSLVNASIRIDDKDADSCNNYDTGDCDNCHGIIHGNSNCVLLGGLSKAKNLALIAESQTYVFKMDLKWCPTFSNLKTLLLSDYWCVALDLDTITCILKNSPLLEKLTFELFSEGSDHNMVVKGSHILVQKTGAISEYLEIVEVKCDVVDGKVYKVLKLLSIFNIRFSFE